MRKVLDGRWIFCFETFYLPPGSEPIWVNPDSVEWVADIADMP